ncbi:unknown [Prevotella sp. CAG:617]|nr:unknown [Prevotella sp. CAG:617]
MGGIGLVQHAQQLAMHVGVLLAHDFGGLYVFAIALVVKHAANHQENHRASALFLHIRIGIEVYALASLEQPQLTGRTELMLKQILIIKLIQHKNARHVLKGVAVHHAQQTAEHAVAQKTVTESGHHARAADACHTGGNAAIHIRLNGIMENIIRPFLAIDAIKVGAIY